MYLWVGLLDIGVARWTLLGAPFRVAECTLNNGQAGGVENPVVPSQIYQTQEQTSQYVAMFLHVNMQAPTLLRTFHEDLGGHGAALQARTVANSSRHRVARSHWSWKDIEKKKDTYFPPWIKLNRQETMWAQQ